MYLHNCHRLSTAPCGIRAKKPSGKRDPFYLFQFRGNVHEFKLCSLNLPSNFPFFFWSKIFIIFQVWIMPHRFLKSQHRIDVIRKLCFQHLHLYQSFSAHLKKITLILSFVTYPRIQIWLFGLLFPQNPRRKQSKYPVSLRHKLLNICSTKFKF